jgi:hypothetical protein
VSRDQLIGDAVEVIAHDLRLWTHAQNIVADPPDQRGLPACRDRAEGVPGMAGNQTELRGPDAKLLLDMAVGLAGRLVVPDAVGTEPPFEEIDDGGFEPRADCR